MQRLASICALGILATFGARAVAVEQMVAAANPIAAEAGMAVLRDGGSAADAAVAIQAMLNLVEPQSSGIGGGAFILYWDASARSLLTIDGRETAPASATPERFLDDKGEKRGFWESAVGGQAVGVPGTVKSIDLLHRLYGKKAWASLLEPAIALAEKGFSVSPRLAKSIASAKHLQRFDATRDYFFDAQGQPLEQGTILRNPAFAETLRVLAGQGADAFYSGPIAAGIVAAVNASSWHTNNITLSDLSAYKAKIRVPVCQTYRGYEVCGMGPPTSGGLTVGQILGMLEGFDLQKMGWGAELVHHVAQAEKLAYADRAMYMGDSDFVPVPTAGLLNSQYLAARAALIDADKAGPKALAGTPPGAQKLVLAPSVTPGLVGTSHFVIRDAEGNVLSMTTTIESGFGSRVMTGGFLLNNELTDFDRAPMRDGKPVANRVQAGKRPRSSMSPTIVMRNGAPHLALGSPGGSRIIGYVAKTIIGVIDFGLSPQEAINHGHFVHRNGKTLELETGTDAATFEAALKAKGHAVKVGTLTSGIHAILLGENGLTGGADARREGVVLSH
jgi:gamma-glutamyltranspeptidase / glutathione hydrolase